MSAACIVRHEGPSGPWLVAHRASALPVRDCVPAYVGYAERTLQPMRRLEVPHPNITVIINLGVPLAVHAPALDRAGATFRSFAAGLFDTAALTESVGHAAGIELNLTPLGMWRLMGVPMHSLMNRVVGLDALLGQSAMRLEERLREERSWDRRFDVLDRVLTARLNTRADAPIGVRWAYMQLLRHPKPMAVSAIASELQWSRRRLVLAFREHIGMTPKSAARVIRFDRVVRRVRAVRPAPWSTLALDCGYADQAHMSREFREFAGMTPSEYLHRTTAGGVTAD